MEDNIADALKLAAFVLIFVLAVSICISSFSITRQAIDFTLNQTDREYYSTYVENSQTTERLVSLETIIPNILRAYTENYKIYFFDKENNPITIYSKTNGGRTVNINYIDLEKEVINKESLDEFIQGILYGTLKLEENIEEIFEKRNIKFTNEGIYGIIKKGDKFKENLGEYYQEADSEENLNSSDTSSVPEGNKVKKRVITYIKQ